MRTKNGREQALQVEFSFFGRWKAGGDGTGHQGMRSLDLEGARRRTRQPLALKAWERGAWRLGFGRGRGARLGSALQRTDGFKICKIKSPSPPSILKCRTLAARSLCSRQTCCLYSGHIEWDHLRSLGTEAQQRLAEVGSIESIQSDGSPIPYQNTDGPAGPRQFFFGKTERP